MAYNYKKNCDFWEHSYKDFSELCEEIRKGSEMESITRLLIIGNVTKTWFKCISSLPWQPHREMALLLHATDVFLVGSVDWTIEAAAIPREHKFFTWPCMILLSSSDVCGVTWARVLPLALPGGSAVVPAVVSSTHQAGEQCAVVAFMPSENVENWVDEKYQWN